MDDLRARLRRLEQHSQAPAVPSPVPRRGGRPLEELVAGGRWLECGGRRCFVAEYRYSLDHAHGGQQLGDVLAVPRQQWQPFVREGRFAPEHALFVDTETTGLMRGGTYAFMVGVGYFEPDGFRLRQYFMPDYADEEALLDLLADDLGTCQGLVTFNGRSFDWPIIASRYVMARRPLPAPEEPHLDLLPLSRRLWRRTLPSCALSHLESAVLGVARESLDVPGYLIPQLYDDYIRWGHTEPMAGVFYHNRIDVLSMVTLAGRIGGLLTAPSAHGAADGRDDLALARLYERLGRIDEAVAAYTRACAAPLAADRDLADHDLSFLFKRLGRLDEAMDIWQRQLGGGAVYPYVELAKQYEHRLRDDETAHRLTMEAITWVEAHRSELGIYAAGELLAELQHRLERLARRLAQP
jgi:uncharacterized protein YprB with RNaseH-like and TPR domain